MTSRSWVGAGPLFVIGLAACADHGGSEGALAQASANVACAPSDATCVFGGLDAPLAQGTDLPLNVQVTARGLSAPRLRLVSADEGVFTASGGTVRGIAPGFASLLMLAPGDIVVDFLTLSVEPADGLRIHRAVDGGGTYGTPIAAKVQLLVGDDDTFSVHPYAGETRLLGAIPATWKVDGDAVQILDEGVIEKRRIVARAPGTVTLEAEGLGLSAGVTLEVLP